MEDKLLKNLRTYNWICNDCKKKGEYTKFEWQDVVLRCPYCRSMNIDSKLNRQGK